VVYSANGHTAAEVLHNCRTYTGTQGYEDKEKNMVHRVSSRAFCILYIEVSHTVSQPFSLTVGQSVGRFFLRIFDSISSSLNLR